MTIDECEIYLVRFSTVMCKFTEKTDMTQLILHEFKFF